MKKLAILFIITGIGILSVITYRAISQTTIKPDTAKVVVVTTSVETTVTQPPVTTGENIEDEVQPGGYVKQVKWDTIMLYLIALFGCILHYFSAMANNASWKMKTNHSAHWLGLALSSGLTLIFVYGYDYLPESIHQKLGQLNPITALVVGYFVDSIWKQISPFKGAKSGTVLQPKDDLLSGGGNNHDVSESETDAIPPADK